MKKSRGFLHLLILFVLFLLVPTPASARWGFCWTFWNCGDSHPPPPPPPPSEEERCRNVAGAWLSGAGCCGDANDDCGTQVNGALCSMNSNFTNSNWVSATNVAGKIVTVGCKNTDYVSDGSSWIGCNNFSITRIAGHDYLCNGIGTIVQQ